MTNPLRSGVLIVCLFFWFNSPAQNILILNSQENNAAHLMDINWASVCTEYGYNSEIISFNSLDNFQLIQQAALIIVATGVVDLSDLQLENLKLYVKSGGNLYIQSEHILNSGGNNCFKYLVNNLNGYFRWENITEANLAPIRLINGLNIANESIEELEHFWYGAYGCGDQTITPILERNGNYYGFFFKNSNPLTGRIITTSDQDWVRLSHLSGHERSKPIMAQIINLLLHGNPNRNINPELILNPPFESCNDDNYSLVESDLNENEIKWYVNNMHITNGANLDINLLQNGDRIFAIYPISTTCGVEENSSDTLEYTSPTIHEPKETLLSGKPLLCPSESLILSVIADPALEIINHFWFINGIEQSTSNEVFVSEHIDDGDVITHVLEYSDGCDVIRLSTESEVIVQVLNPELPEILLSTDNVQPCKDELVTLRLDGLEKIEHPTITWFLDGKETEKDNSEFSILSNVNPQEIYAIVSFMNSCHENVLLKTKKQSITAIETAITIEEIGHTSCDQPYGFIEVNAGVGNFHYLWNNGMKGPYVNGLEAGSYVVTATSENGCSSNKTIRIEQTQESLVEDLEVNLASCVTNLGYVRIHPLPRYRDKLKVFWWDEADVMVAQDILAVEMTAGQYRVSLESEGRCQEVLDIEVKYEQTSIIEDTSRIIVDEGNGVQLETDYQVSSNDDIQWLSSLELSCYQCLNPIVQAKQEDLIQYIVSKPEGCQVVGNIDLKLVYDKPYYAPNAFSPNGDGQNDFFKILPKPKVHASGYLKIFDRWGNLVHLEENELEQGWDGSAEGIKLQPGIYVYFQEFQDERGQKYIARGSVTKL